MTDQLEPRIFAAGKHRHSQRSQLQGDRRLGCDADWDSRVSDGYLNGGSLVGPEIGPGNVNMRHPLR